ncbi:MAG TPA: GNAT family N-acetyltransferase [Actinomycetota bacterium]|jgi:RimJ/RimL family protein N-acetyltransferase
MELVLRETTLDDLPILFAHQQDPVATEMAAFPSRDWDAFVAHDAKLRDDPTAIRRTVVVDGEVVGWIGCYGDDERDVGYWIDRASWGRGIATAALAAFLDEIAERPLFGRVVVHNTGSIRVLERSGFVEIGRQVTDVEEIVFRLG